MKNTNILDTHRQTDGVSVGIHCLRKIGKVIQVDSDDEDDGGGDDEYEKINEENYREIVMRHMIEVIEANIHVLLGWIQD